MDDLGYVRMGNLKIKNSVKFLINDFVHTFTPQANCNFLNLSHTLANRHECPCCKDFSTSPTHGSIVSLSLENLDFKFVTLTRAATQPVALFMAFGPWARYHNMLDIFLQKLSGMLLGE